MTASRGIQGAALANYRRHPTADRVAETPSDISPRLIEGMAYTVTRKEVRNVKVKTKVKAADVVMGFWE